MAYKPIRMKNIKQIMDYYQNGVPKKRIARLMGMSKNTVKRYIEIVQSKEVDWKIDSSELKKLLYSHHNRQMDKRDEQLQACFADISIELNKVGVTRHLLWEEYKAKFPDGFSYSRFCRKLKQYKARQDVTLRLEHKAAEVLTVDYTGKKMAWIDKVDGQTKYAEVLVCTLPCSGLTFACAVKTQQQHDFIHAINQALLYFGGLPKIIRSDNLKSFVTKTDRYEPTFNQLCVQLSSYYGVELDATRPYKPKDKAHVERHVRIVYSAVFAKLRNETFHSIEAINRGFAKHLRTLNNKNFQNKEYSRNDQFEKIEKLFLDPLPSQLFEIKKSTKAKVQRNYHVILGEDKHQYSVPYKYVGQHTEIQYNAEVVEIFIQLDRIAIHPRDMRNNAYSTKEDHMPEKHRAYLEQTKWDADYFRQQAQLIGEHTLWAIDQILSSKSFIDQAYKTCIGVLRLSNKYTSQRLENACKRAHKTHNVSYRILTNILQNNMDMLDDSPKKPFLIPQHENLRGAKNFK